MLHAECRQRREDFERDRPPTARFAVGFAGKVRTVASCLINAIMNPACSIEACSDRSKDTKEGA